MLKFTPVQAEIVPVKSSHSATKPKDIDEIFEEFLGFEVACGAASGDTIVNYKSQVKLFLQWCIDNQVNPLLADKYHIRAFRSYLIERKFAASTIALKLQVVKRFYDALIDRRLTSHNPAKNVKAPINRRTNLKVNYLSQEQFEKLLVLTSGDDPKQLRDRAMICLMGLQGLRTVEVQKLNFGHFVSKGNNRFIKVSSKRAEREIKLREDIWQLILLHLKGKRLSSSLPIFCSMSGNSYGRRISRDGIRRTVNHYLSQIGVRGKGIEIQLSNHSLRHTYGTLVYTATKDLRLVQDSMGHTDPRTTAKYAHVCNETHAADCIDLNLKL